MPPFGGTLPRLRVYALVKGYALSIPIIIWDSLASVQNINEVWSNIKNVTYGYFKMKYSVDTNQA